MAVALDRAIGTSWSRHLVEIECASELTRGMTIVDRLNVAADDNNREAWRDALSAGVQGGRVLEPSTRRLQGDAEARAGGERRQQGDAHAADANLLGERILALSAAARRTIPCTGAPGAREALAEARRRDCPILLSIGYAACHWCHVMAHESFEDADTAALMNRLFVNVKVDREERPDIDHHLHGGAARDGRSRAAGR